MKMIAFLTVPFCTHSCDSVANCAKIRVKKIIFFYVKCIYIVWKIRCLPNNAVFSR